MKSLFIIAALLIPAIAYAGDEPQETKPPNICHTTSQPIGTHTVFSKHCWSYRGGPGSVLVQTTVTWSSSAAMVKKAPTKPGAAVRSSELADPR